MLLHFPVSNSCQRIHSTFLIHLTRLGVNPHRYHWFLKLIVATYKSKFLGKKCKAYLYLCFVFEMFLFKPNRIPYFHEKRRNWLWLVKGKESLHFMITMRCIYLNLKKYWLLTLEMVEVQLSIFWQLLWGRQVNQWIFPEQILIMILLKAFLLFTNHFRRHLTMWAHDLN